VPLHIPGISLVAAFAGFDPDEIDFCFHRQGDPLAREVHLLHRDLKEQINKRKPDGEFAEIHLGHINSAGDTVEVFCPESKGVEATQNPRGAKVISVT
jgi:hypothetical protein